MQTIAQLKGNIARLETQLRGLKDDLQRSRSPSPRRKVDRRSGWSQTSPNRVGAAAGLHYRSGARDTLLWVLMPLCSTWQCVSSQIGRHVMRQCSNVRCVSVT